MRYSVEANVTREYIRGLLTAQTVQPEVLLPCEEALQQYTEDVPVLTTEVYEMDLDRLNAEFKRVSDWLDTLGSKRIGLSLSPLQCALAVKMLIGAIIDLQITMAGVLQYRDMVEQVDRDGTTT